VLIFDPDKPLSPQFTDTIGTVVRDALDARRTGGDADVLIDVALRHVAGGKRIRPAFCVWGYLALAAPPTNPAGLLRVAASLELLHLSALVHDDVMDASATRRGMPAVHVELADAHRASGWHGDPDAFGRSGAIVLGNLLATWAADLAETAIDAWPDDDGTPDRPDSRPRARSLLSAVRTDVNVGQYLDALAQAHDPGQARHDPEGAQAIVRDVVETKTALYTVTRPLQIGAALAGADDAMLAALAAFGSLLGRAFQYRDDLLGVFGDPSVTGKPAGDDLREGKLTALVAHAMADAGATDADRLAGLLGNPDLDAAGVAEARAIIRRCGAEAAVEADINDARSAALRVLADMSVREEARRALTSLVSVATDRET